MASISNDPGGRRRVLFFDSNGERRTLRLGQCSKQQANTVRGHVENLVAAKTTRAATAAETAHWLAGLDDVMADKLAEVGLIPRRESQTLGGWLNKFMETRASLKPASLRKLSQTKEKLLAFFPESTPLRDITADQASDWRAGLVKADLSEAVVKIHSGNVKTIFREALERKLIAESPFAHLTSGVTAAKNDRYVTAQEAETVLQACPNLRWRLIFGLARFAGLRTPSETRLLTWADVDWTRGRLTVRSPKTERYAGHEQRVVPITSSLMTLLHEGFTEALEADDGEQRIVRVPASCGHLFNTMADIVRRSGIPLWSDLFQTLRRSCEIEWAQVYPQFAVSKWIGHSIAVSGRHYANMVPDELYERMAGARVEEDAKRAAHKAAQQPTETACNDLKAEKLALGKNEDNSADCIALQQSAELSTTWRGGESNPHLRIANASSSH